jgi:hypothetical protein
MDTWIREAQRFDIRPILGDAFYQDFVTKFNNTGASEYSAYQDLLNGVTYTYNSQTIKFEGVKPCLVYYAYARMIKNQQVNVAPHSVVQKLTPQSQPVSASMIKLQVDDALSAAVVYQNEIIQFLDTKSTDYPLWTERGSEIVRKTSFNFFRA